MNENVRGMGWRKSSYSNGQGQCVEVGKSWRKSAHSNGQRACAEIAPTPHAILIRDTANRSGPTLTIPAPAWRALLAHVRVS
jgi:hypothetical protein